MIFAPTTVSLTKAELRALVTHSSTDETRPRVNAILFNATERCAVATDGHRLAICEADGDAAPWSYLMPRAAAETALRAPKAEVYILNTVSQDLTAFDKQNRKIGTFDARKVDAQFSPYRQVLGTPSDRGVSQGFNAAYLADVALVTAAAPESGRMNGVVFHPGAGELDPAHFTSGRWTVVLMPMRCDTSVPKRKAPQAAPEAPSAAIVLATRATSVEAMPAPQDAKGADVVRIVTAPVNASSLGSDLAPVALLAARKSKARAWREAYASTADHQDPATLRAWVDDAPAVDVSLDRAPWG